MNMKEEKILLGRIGNDRPFKVPEGYFADFNRQIMDKLPEKQSCTVPCHRPVVLRYFRRVAAAACFVAFAFGAGILYFNGNDTERHVSELQQQPAMDYTIDEMVDYAMLDNEQIYNYVIDEQ